ncbi:uncharacterized protein LOC110061469 [Orbicella faveolata]|uniref:uncharacterized protein LOC110061469 n=1 Tax=Orbicella faveolata TaxID=48498 RepID=UPI0009E472E8|nr:uncharacterized protein LOC110061469 [Orbicella faveolata]
MSTRPRAIPLVMITMRKSIQGFPFLSYMSMGLYYNINITVLLQGGTALISQEDGAELSVLPRYNTNSIANKTLKRRSSSTTCGQLNVTLLAAEWGSIKHGDLSTVNRELAINLAKVQECKNEKVKVQVTFFVPKCSHQERGEAKTFNVAIAEAKKYPGMDIYTCLCFPTGDLAIDVVIGHDVKLGGQAQIIKEQHNCKWVQVVHTDTKDPNGQTENKDVIKLCENADLVMTVGPKLKEVYSSQLRGCEREDNVFEFTPGIMEELDIQHALHDNATFKVLFLGRTDLKNFKQKGYDIAVKAFKNELKGENYCLVFVCAPEKRVDEVAEYLRSAFGIPEEQFEVKAFVESREDLKGLFREVDLAIMPSRTEGFGLTALEAFSAGLPVLAFDVSFTGNTPGHNLDTGFLASRQAGLLWMLRDGKECCLSMYSRAKTNSVSNEMYVKVVMC